MSMFPTFIELIKKSNNTALCGAVNQHCNNECHCCPFGSEENVKHLVNSFDMINLMMGDTFRKDP